MTTILDVARNAKVSPSTVSLVANDLDGVHPDTRRRVEAVIKKLGYQRGRGRRPKRYTATRTIAVTYRQNWVGGRDGSQIHALACDWINGIRRVVRSYDSHLNVMAGFGHIDQDRILHDMVKHREVDGLILLGSYAADGYLDWCARSGVPMLAMNRQPENEQFSTIMTENYSSSCAVASLFAVHDRKRVALIAPEADLYYNRKRCEGFRAGAREAGLDLVYESRVGYKADPLHAACWAALQAGAQAIYLPVDGLAVECVNFLEAEGVDVPGEVAVVGFDDLGRVSAGGKRLTSVGYDREKMGELAAETLMRQLDEPHAIRAMSIVVPTELHEYDTTPKAAAGRRKKTL